MKDLPITMEPDNWMEKTGGYAKDMTLRDYLASKAMEGLLASTRTTDARIIAIDAYSMADAMLKAGQ